MTTDKPAYPITLAGVELQVGAHAAYTANLLRGRFLLSTLYNNQTLSAPNFVLSTVPQVLEALKPSLRTALEKLRTPSNLLDLSPQQRGALSACIDEARSCMGSNNYKISAFLVPELPGNAEAQIKAYDARFIERHTPIILALKAKGLTLDELTAFANCTPYHENRVVIRTGHDWRL